MSQRKVPWGWVLVAGLLVLALVIIPLALGGSESPKAWLDDHYTSTGGTSEEDGGLTWSSDDDAASTVSAIEAGTGSEETRQEGETYYLRYDSDWLVTVEEQTDGTEITLFEFDEGYRRHGGVIGFWGGYYQRGGSGLFRGGGSGFGK